MQRLARPALSGLRSAALRQAPRRFASTASPADKSRSWKSSALRWGLAVGAVYYYTTSSVFADEATPLQATFSAAPSSFPTSDNNLPTVESVLEEKRKQNTPPAPAAESKSKTEETKNESENTAEAVPAGSPADLEEEAGQQGAFDPETGEINWDCPCLGGMAHGPCGEEFKAAFSCFVHSTEEPKGMDCIEKFQGMQECFRKYPEIYGAELADEEDAEPDFGEETPESAGAAAPAAAAEKVAEPESTPAAPAAEIETPKTETKIQIEPDSKPEPAETVVKAHAAPEKTGPKWEDATTANDAIPAKKD